MTTYAEKLKDVRWQKKRLKILERAEFKCECCRLGEGDNISLHVHHGYYLKGRDPWDYPDDSLVSLCEDCHLAFENERHALLENIAKPGSTASKLLLLQAVNSLLYSGSDVYSYSELIDSSWMISSDKLIGAVANAFFYAATKNEQESLLRIVEQWNEPFTKEEPPVSGGQQ